MIELDTSFLDIYTIRNICYSISPERLKHSFEMSDQNIRRPPPTIDSGLNVPTKSPPLSPTANPREHFQKLIDADFKARQDAAIVAFEASTTGPAAIPIHPLPEFQRINSRLYAKNMARATISDLRSEQIVDIPDADPFANDMQVEVNFLEEFPSNRETEQVAVAMSKFRAWASVYESVQERMTWLEIEKLFQQRLKVEWNKIEAEGFERTCKAKETSDVWYPKPI
ncbi:hypothetical protein FKW77_007115 [Venturia effusa]|uniref:Uncharacterized protein n=1 Tax=Venturia effusa TaxID=50376 RepID=A0A517L7K3_9PEZI|nr:hypothetical protein FKW77_007115 [Venturia effusa]